MFVNLGKILKILFGEDLEFTLKMKACFYFDTASVCKVS